MEIILNNEDAKLLRKKWRLRLNKFINELTDDDITGIVNGDIYQITIKINTEPSWYKKFNQNNI